MAAKGVRFVQENNTYSYSPPQSPSPRQAYSPAQLEDPYLPQTPPRPPLPQTPHTARFIEENAIQFYSPTPIPSLSPAHLLPDACAPPDTPSPQHRPSAPLPPSPPRRVSAPHPPSTGDTPSSTFSLSTLSPQSGSSKPVHDDLPIDPDFYEDGLLPYLKYTHPKAITPNVVERPTLPSTLSGAEIATYSHASSMKLVCQSLAWPIDLKRDDGSPLTVSDVLDGIYCSLRTPLTTAEYTAQVDSTKLAITRAFYGRLEHLRDPLAKDKERQKGVRRVDSLPRNSRFLGLFPTQEPATYQMFIGNE